MGGCLGQRDKRSQNQRLAAKVFDLIDVAGQQKLNNKNLTEFFKEYPDSSVKLLMNAMDFDQDGVISKVEWLAYWEYIRRSGYEEAAIKKSLTQLQNGTVFLNFPKAQSYQSGVPRETVVKGIINECKDDGIVMPIKLQP